MSLWLYIQSLDNNRWKDNKKTKHLHMHICSLIHQNVLRDWIYHQRKAYRSQLWLDKGFLWKFLQEFLKILWYVKDYKPAW